LVIKKAYKPFSMLDSIDHVIIAVEDLDEASKNYEMILGNPPVWKGEHKEFGTKNTLFNFQNTYLELLAAGGEGIGADLIKHTLKNNGEGLNGIVFGTSDMNQFRTTMQKNSFNLADASSGEGVNLETGEKRTWINQFLVSELSRGLFSFIIEHTAGKLAKVNKYSDSSVRRLDHVVITTNDAEGFIKTYRDIFNIRLALDKFVEHWQKRMLFFRLNKTTIEVIEEKNQNDAIDKLWGLAWNVIDLASCRERLMKLGVDVTEIKKGVKEGTLVMTIKSHTHSVPTLFIEHT
jgi:catechol 2,3-dioxygenase-like lactoylglutathione lyase family enzyme